MSSPLWSGFARVEPDLAISDHLIESVSWKIDFRNDLRFV